MEDYDKDNRIPQLGDSTEDGFRSVLAEASDISYRMFKSIQVVAGITACKGVQINALRKYAVENQCWFSDISSLFHRYNYLLCAERKTFRPTVPFHPAFLETSLVDNLFT